MICPNCNAEVSDDATFCPECGAKLDGTETSQETSTTTETGGGFRLSKKVIAIAIIVVAMIILALSCPNKQTHVEALNNAIMTALTESMAKNSTMKGGADDFTTGLASSLVPKVLNSKLNIHNYFIFSVGELTDEGKTKTVSFGILGHVFPIGLSDSEKQLDEAINGKHK